MLSGLGFLRSRKISQHNLPLLYIASFLRMFMLIMPIRILWMQQTLTNAQISILTGWIFLSVLLFELPTGALADLFGKRWTLILGSFIFALAMIAYLLASGFWSFALAMTLQGLSESLKSGADVAILYDSLAEDGRQKEYRLKSSQIAFWVQVAIVAGTFLGGWLGVFGLDIPIKATIGVVVFAAIVDYFLIEPKIDTQKFTLQNYKKQVIDGTKHLFRTTEIAWIASLYTLVAGIGWTFQRLLRDMILIEAGYDQLGIGLIGGTLRLINILLLVKLVRSAKLVNGGWDILLLPILMVASYLPGIWLNHLSSLWIVAGIMMIGTGRFLIYGPHLQERIDSKYRTTAVSAANMLISLFLAINLFALGLVFEIVSLKQILVGYGILSLVLVVPLALKVRKITTN